MVTSTPSLVFFYKIDRGLISAPSLASKRLINAQKSLKTPTPLTIHLMLIMWLFMLLRKICFNPLLTA